VYFFYDPDLMSLSFGTFGALKEIAFVNQLAKAHSSLKNYYMGFYIHSCVKMRYKGNYSPSYLLCPETYVWRFLDDGVRNKLSQQKFSRLNDSPTASANEPNQNDIRKVWSAYIIESLLGLMIFLTH
jgi:arginine-tRNA-protein transferase